MLIATSSSAAQSALVAFRKIRAYSMLSEPSWLDANNLVHGSDSTKCPYNSVYCGLRLDMHELEATTREARGD